MVPVYWLILVVVLVLIEIPTMGLTTIWFAGGALAAWLISVLGLPAAVQFAVFAAVSLLMLLMTRPFAVKYLNQRVTRTNVDEVPGKRAVVTETIDNLQGRGRVKLDGNSWSARSVNGENIEEGALVIVDSVQGVKLMVFREKEKEEV